VSASEGRAIAFTTAKLPNNATREGRIVMVDSSRLKCNYSTGQLQRHQVVYEIGVSGMSEARFEWVYIYRVMETS